MAGILTITPPRWQHGNELLGFINYLTSRETVSFSRRTIVKTWKWISHSQFSVFTVFHLYFIRFELDPKDWNHEILRRESVVLYWPWVFTLQSLLLRGLGRAKITLKHVSISAVLTLALRPLVSAGFSEKLMTMFLIHILSVPALVLHIQTLAAEVRNCTSHTET
jgi:hypothetical protein